MNVFTQITDKNLKLNETIHWIETYIFCVRYFAFITIGLPEEGVRMDSYRISLWFFLPCSHLDVYIMYSQFGWLDFHSFFLYSTVRFVLSLSSIILICTSNIFILAGTTKCTTNTWIFLMILKVIYTQLNLYSHNNNLCYPHLESKQ